MNDKLAPNRVCLGSCDLFKFSEISDNISETFQDRDMVAMEAYLEIVCGMWPIEWRHCQCP